MSGLSWPRSDELAAGVAFWIQALYGESSAAHRARGGPWTFLRLVSSRCSPLWPKAKSNIGVARELDVTETAVEKHITSIFRKLRFGAKRNNHRRVQAVLAYTEAQAGPQPGPAEQH